MSEKVQIVTPNAPSPAGPYSQGIVAGDFLFVAGQRPQNPITGEIPDNIEGQTRQVIENLQAILAERGCTLKNVVKSTVYVSDLKYFAQLNTVYRELFPEPFPVRTTVGTQLRGILIEIDAIAYIGK